MVVTNVRVLLQGALLSQFLPQPLRLASITVSLPAASSQPYDAASSAAAADSVVNVSATNPGAAPAPTDADATQAAAVGHAQAAAATTASAVTSCPSPPPAAVVWAMQRALYGRIAPRLAAAAAPTGVPKAYSMQNPPSVAVHVVPAALPLLGLQPSPTRQSPSGALLPAHASGSQGVTVSPVIKRYHQPLSLAKPPASPSDCDSPAHRIHFLRDGSKFQNILCSKWIHFGQLTAPFATGASVNWSAPPSVACPAAVVAGRTASGGRELASEGSRSTVCSSSGDGGRSASSWMQQVLAGGGGGAHPGWHEATQVRIVSVRRSATLAACA